MPLFPITIGGPGNSMKTWQMVQGVGSFLCLAGASTVVSGSNEALKADASKKVRNGAMVQLLGACFSTDPLQLMFAFMTLDSLTGDNSLLECSVDKFKNKVRLYGGWSITLSVLAMVAHVGLALSFSKLNKGKAPFSFIAPPVASAAFTYY
jgi:hypothetical protein